MCIDLHKGGFMDHNIIALIWDFDKTLVDGYMQDPIFKKYGIEAKAFWDEVNALPGEYAKRGIRVNKDTIYLNHFLTCIEQGIFPGLNNDLLKELGAELNFYKGVPEIFERISDSIEKDEELESVGIKVEHYIVSTGMKAMIEGSAVKDFVKDIWGCEFIERPIKANLHIKEVDGHEDKDRMLSQIAYAMDNTTKTRAIYEINKGTNVNPEIDVNAKVVDEIRRVPFENMIYIADGPSDVPAFSLLRGNGGRAFAVYPQGDVSAFRQVDKLRQQGRIDMYGLADYSEGTLTEMWLRENARQIAFKIKADRDSKIRMGVSNAPKHITD